jgi:hypothetical protein
VQGLPFSAREIEDGIEKLLGGSLS